MRAKKLEKHLGVGKIYLKLEGTNPFGNKYDRIAEVMVKGALAQDNDGVFVDGSDDYINSVVQFCKEYGLSVKIPLFKNQKWKTKLFNNDVLVDFRETNTHNKYHLEDRYCRENNLYKGSNQYTNKNISMVSLQKIGEEISEKLGDDISSVFTQLSYGYTVSSLYNAFVSKWVDGKINKYPQIFSCTIPKGNAIFDDYKKNMEINGLDDYDIKVNKYTRHLLAGEGALFEETLKAIHDTHGNIISVDEKLLKESVHVLKKKENIILSTEDGYSFAGFYKLAKEGKIKEGKHVIILNDGRSDLELYRVTDFERYSKETISNWIKEWLQDYSDPIHETKDAVESAIESGFILIALRNNIPQGVCVVVHTGFEDFLPTYHLGYVATKEGNKGRGIATELINQMIEFTDGKLSLHVDLDNKRASKLYEKLGFKKCYYRMIYSGQE